MLIGHFAVAFAAKKASPKTSLGTFFCAALFVDLICIALLLMGIEKITYDPGNTAVTPLDFAHYPYSHSLLMTLIWAAVFAFVYRAAHLEYAEEAGAVCVHGDGDHIDYAAPGCHALQQAAQAAQIR